MNIEESKARTYKLRKEKHIRDAVRGKKRAIRNLRYANKRLLELGVKEDVAVYCKEPGCKGDH